MMKFAIFREIENGKRKFLLEWNQEEIEAALIQELPEVGAYNIHKAFNNVVDKFKKESIRIP